MRKIALLQQPPPFLPDNNTLLYSSYKAFLYVDIVSATVLYTSVSHLWTEAVFFDENRERWI